MIMIHFAYGIGTIKDILDLSLWKEYFSEEDKSKIL